MCIRDRRWFPHSPAWVWSAAFIAVVFLLNILSVRLYGESEFWFCLLYTSSASCELLLLTALPNIPDD